MLKWNGMAMKQARESAGLSQLQVAIALAQCGATKNVLSRQRISQWEGTKGKPPRFSTAASIATILGVPMERLVVDDGITDPEQEAESGAESVSEPEAVAMA